MFEKSCNYLFLPVNLYSLSESLLISLKDYDRCDFWLVVTCCYWREHCVEISSHPPSRLCKILDHLGPRITDALQLEVYQDDHRSLRPSQLMFKSREFYTKLLISYAWLNFGTPCKIIFIFIQWFLLTCLFHHLRTNPTSWGWGVPISGQA